MDPEELEDNPRAVAADASDNEGESEAVDYRFLAAINKKDCSIPARGEKDFEPDGTNKQIHTLAASRDAMYAALSVERDLASKSYIRATWDAEKCLGRLPSADSRGTMFKSIGKADSHGTTWLQPEELLFMVERGNMECFYASVDVGMSLQAAYAELLPYIGVDEFQVYAYLKRAGFMVQRARPALPATNEGLTGQSFFSLNLSATLRRLKSIMQGALRSQRGPLSRHSVYRSYNAIYNRLSLVPCHTFETRPSPALPSQSQSHTLTDSSPLKVSWNVWKPNTHFKKSAPGEPDFRIAVLNSRNHDLFSLQHVSALFATLPEDKTYCTRSQMDKLKTGKRHCILAVADLGVVSFLTIGDVSFGSEHVYVPWQPAGEKRARDKNHAKGTR